MAWKRLIFLFLFLSSIVEAKEFNLKKIISLEEPWGSTFISDTESPLDSNKAPIDAAAIPLPSDDTTPPVIKMYLVFAIIKVEHDGR